MALAVLYQSVAHGDLVAAMQAGLGAVRAHAERQARDRPRSAAFVAGMVADYRRETEHVAVRGQLPEFWKRRLQGDERAYPIDRALGRAAAAAPAPDAVRAP